MEEWWWVSSEVGEGETWADMEIMGHVGPWRVLKAEIKDMPQADCS